MSISYQPIEKEFVFTEIRYLNRCHLNEGGSTVVKNVNLKQTCKFVISTKSSK